MPPTLAVLVAVGLVEAFRHQRILFASLASSAFLIYRDPRHPMNGLRVTVPAHLVGVGLGVVAAVLLGAGYLAGALAMVGTIVVLVGGDIVHPPAISTALGFAFFPRQDRVLGFFLVALLMLGALVILERLALWLAERATGP